MPKSRNQRRKQLGTYSHASVDHCARPSHCKRTNTVSSDGQQTPFPLPLSQVNLKHICEYVACAARTSMSSRMETGIARSTRFPNACGMWYLYDLAHLLSHNGILQWQAKVRSPGRLCPQCWTPTVVWFDNILGGHRGLAQSRHSTREIQVHCLPSTIIDWRSSVGHP